MVRAFISAGADIHLKDVHGKTATQYAASNGQTEVVKVLIKHGAANKNNNYEADALICALVFGKNAEAAELLINAGAIDCIAFIHAAKLNYTNIVQLMLDKHPKIINCQSGWTGWNALMAAAYNGNLETLRFLLKKGANIYYKDNEGKTALDLAILQKHEEVAELLQSTILEQTINFNIFYWLNKKKAVIHNKIQEILRQQEESVFKRILLFLDGLSHFWRLLIKKVFRN